MGPVKKTVEAASAIFTGKTFSGNLGGTVPMTFHEAVVPPKERDVEDIPFCWVHRTGFQSFPHVKVQVSMEFILFEKDDATAAVEAALLGELMDGFTTAGLFSPLKLDAITGFEGEKDSGIHPPEHRLYTYLLELSGGRKTKQ